MSKDANFKALAEYYDLIYSDKNYAGEVNFVEKCFEKFGKPPKILEIGCGTGNYTKILLERGYKITGLDISKEMLAIARQKCTNCEFVENDIRNISISGKFDSCLALFAVMSYMTQNSDITSALANIRKLLNPGGLFVFDVWNGLGLMRNLPESRLKEIETDKLKILRFARPTLKAFEHVCEVNYRLVILEKNNSRFEEIKEKHIMRFYFPQEIKYYLENAGFEILKICPFLDFDGNVTQDIWQMTIVARIPRGSE